jgi:hypothetical protein
VKSLNPRITWQLFILLAWLPSAAHARVVINEIFYHAPDDIEDLEYVELHNSGDQPVDLSGWAFTRGMKFKFPPGTQIKAKGFLVLCRNRERFKEYYNTPVAGVFDQPLSNKGERVELSDASGKVVDAIRYSDSAPWPMGADGFSGSLERISPDENGEDSANWASSRLSEDRLKPAGTPGKPNANYSANLPPVISNLRFAPEDPSPGQPMTVEADVSDTDGVGEVKLLYRLASPGLEKPESSVAMNKSSEGRYAATIPGQAKDLLIRFRIQATDAKGARRFFPAETEPRPAFSCYAHGPITPAKIPFGWVIDTTGKELNVESRPDRRRFGPGGGRFEGPANPPPGRAAFVYFDPQTSKLELFDFVQVVPRSGGVKIHFLKDRPLRQMTTINLIFEYEDRFVLAEPLAYEVYRKAGVAVEQSFHVRLWFDGQPAGYHLLVEQPNRAFLRRNRIRDDGNLYKILWYEQGVVGQHEKKTHTREGHTDIVALVDALEKTRGDPQWEVIEKHFDVNQVINYFAVNMVLSHWDGFFNNYFTYHDRSGTGKWTMYPWDQDKTWGFYDGVQPGHVFYDMPITFGMARDLPSGQRRAPWRGGGFGGGGQPWWREPGYFSGPLLANPRFRKLFLARTKEILETIYTEEIFGPIINAMGDHLREEVRIRAELQKENPEHALKRFERNLQDLRLHLKQRREFLLAQDEIKAAGKFSAAGPGPPASAK